MNYLNLKTIFNILQEEPDQVIKKLKQFDIQLTDNESSGVTSLLAAWRELKPETRSGVEAIVVNFNDDQKIALLKIVVTLLPKQIKQKIRPLISFAEVMYPQLLAGFVTSFMTFSTTGEALETSRSLIDQLKPIPISNTIFNNDNNNKDDNNNNNNDNNNQFKEEPKNSWFKYQELYLFKNEKDEILKHPNHLEVIEFVAMVNRQPHLEELYQNLKLIEVDFIRALRLIAKDLSKGEEVHLPGNLEPPFHYLALVKTRDVKAPNAAPRWVYFDKESGGYRFFFIEDFNDVDRESIQSSFKSSTILVHHKGLRPVSITKVYEAAIRYKQPTSIASNLQQFFANGGRNISSRNIDVVMSLVNSISYASCYSPIDQLSYDIGKTQMELPANQAWNDLVNSEEYKKEKSEKREKTKQFDNIANNSNNSLIDCD